MLFNDVYETIEAPVEGVFKDKGSKFIACAFPFKQEQQLKELLEQVKIKYPKARHYCFAYRLTPDRRVFRVNDDGEPSGTAGRPILNVLLSKNLSDVLVVVVRYFGGTLLGVPGLINAYKSATELALADAKIITARVQDVYQVGYAYAQMNEVMKIVKDADVDILTQDFDLDCKLKIAINQAEVNQVIARLEAIENLECNYLFTR
ncbi:IMPACT family protein [Pelobium manganitolerans]|uniref:IMPACT family protein n=1 Tax=Pelobium manganitolerans TaxID=1842495 RepID=UPI003FA36736